MFQTDGAAGKRDRRFAVLLTLFVVAYGAAAGAYYEKWYSSARKSDVVPYERTSATLSALVPPGPRTIYGSPHFWTPFHADHDTRYRSYLMGPASVHDDQPVYLLVDESQWLHDMQTPRYGASDESWVPFIEQHCALDGLAPGTAYGTIALYLCNVVGRPDARLPRIVGDGVLYELGERIANFEPADLARWARNDDPRRRPGDRPSVEIVDAGLRISGTGWPGIVTDYAATEGEAYLVRVAVGGAHEGDLLYLGTWQQPQVLSLGRASSSGMATSLGHEPWFPGDRAFIATAASVRIQIYSEAPRTDFVVSAVAIHRLIPAPHGAGAH